MKEIAEALCERLAAEGYEPYAYSGRFMYGQHCVAVDLPSSGSLFKLGMAVMRDAECELVDAGSAVEDVYTDSMGRGIVAYWRYVGWPEGYCPPITSEALMKRLEEDFGLPGVYAAESGLLGAEDLALGYEHCVERIAPALEEEMGAHGE